ncbi:FUSC family protein [Marivirga harenae]|uniref:FUSC family protein n=1 Tax=Marivirga harenae TaxID=2010992 RepID=UPI0026E0D0D0|nr:FUSC family membrane protein [Marivirga harenae]WKV12063.1 FUSC family membrane protein [Marivirga harenae]
MTKNLLQKIQNFIGSSDFLKSVLVTFGIVVPVFVGIQINQLPYFLSISIGVFLTSGSDVPGSRKHKSVGILIATSIAMLATIVTTSVASNILLLLPVMALMIFGISYISVYGFRASLISFAGLLAIVLSFAHEQIGSAVFINAMFIGVGGLWYLMLSTVSHRFLQKRQINNKLTECFQLTAEYIRIRGKLALTSQYGKELKNKLFDLQVNLNETHEVLRELLLTERQSSGFSNYKRKQLLIFIELIDILELSMANPANYEQINKLFRNQLQFVEPFIELIFELSNRIDQMAEAMQKGEELPHRNDLEPTIEKCREKIQAYVEEVKLPNAREGALLLHNLLDYEENQLQKIQSVERVFYDLENQSQVGLKNKEGRQFISQQDYDLNILKENFSFKSPIFKHAARLTVAMLLGYGIGTYFSLQNTYWILLTIVVIMRPGYTLTKERSKHRLYGTFIGAGIATVIVLLTQNIYIYTVLSILSLTLALSFIQKNYRTSSIFVTTSIVFIYALINPDAFEVIQFRIIDTIIGAAIAFLAGALLWPAWESASINNTIIQTIRANRKYLSEIDRYYHKSDGLTSYKLARKEAFLEMGNLNAAFQRMSQEPKSQQENLGKINELVGLNHTFLTAMAALGTFIVNHKNDEVSKDVEVIIKTVETNLRQVLQNLLRKIQTKNTSQEVLEAAYQHLEQKFENLVAIRTAELESENFKPIDPEFRKNLQATRLITDQLKWLVTISGNLKKVVKTINQETEEQNH